MWVQIAALAADEQMTILLTTHYLEEADELAAQLAIVDRGRIVASGTPGGAEERAPGRHAPDRARRARVRRRLSTRCSHGLTG